MEEIRTRHREMTAYIIVRGLASTLHLSLEDASHHRKTATTAYEGIINKTVSIKVNVPVPAFVLALTSRMLSIPAATHALMAPFEIFYAWRSQKVQITKGGESGLHGNCIFASRHRGRRHHHHHSLGCQQWAHPAEVLEVSNDSFKFDYMTYAKCKR